MFLIGAETSDLERARPLMEATGKKIVHFGTVGAGTVYKLMHNLLGAVHIAAAAELVAVAQRPGWMATRSPRLLKLVPMQVRPA